MTTMANFNPYYAQGVDIMNPRRSESIWRRTESNLESDFSGNGMFDMPLKGLRRVVSTSDFLSPDHRNTRCSTMLQPTAEENYANNRCTNGNYLNVPYHTAIPSRTSSMNNMASINHGHGINLNSGIPSKRTPYPALTTFFGAPMEREEPYVSKYSAQQQPISRPTPKLNLSNSDPTATTSTANNIKFPVTANLTDKLWSLYEEELSKRAPSLRKEYTEPAPKLTTQPEWPPLRHSYGLAREGREPGLSTKEENDANTRKSFEDSLFPGGLEAFINLNLQQRAQREVINANADGVQLRLASPTPTMRTVPGTHIPPMSGKQLIEDLQEYEHNPAYVGRLREPSHFYSSHNLRGYLGQRGSQQNLLALPDAKPAQPTHDKDGRKRKGFKRGDDALKVAMSENWAVMQHILNAPMEVISLSRYYVIKSNCELDVFASLKHGIWTSTDLGNQRLDKAFRDSHRKGPIYLFFSVSGSGKFCGVAEMTSPVDLSAHAGCWSDKRWRGRFGVQWRIVKDVVNSDLRHFRIANNDHKPFTNCRDTQEILPDVGDQILRMFTNYASTTSLLQSAQPAPKYAVSEEHYLN